MEIVWTEDMGTNYTSFSPMTQGWNEEDPHTIVDPQGRQVLFMEKPPVDWDKKPVYNNLMYQDCVVLDHRRKPVRDIPGFPLTLDSTASGLFLEGLRRCHSTEIPE